MNKKDNNGPETTADCSPAAEECGHDNGLSVVNVDLVRTDTHHNLLYVTDEFSRTCVAVESLPEVSEAEVQAALNRVWKIKGLPRK